MNKKWEKRRKRLFEIIEVGNYYDKASKAYDYFSIIAIVINLIVSVLYTFDEIKADFGKLMLVIEQITVAIFAVDYILRVFTAKYLYPDEKEGKAIKKYVFSFTGIIDLLSFLPYYLPIFFPAGTVAFRMIRIVRILRLFRINAYHDSLSVITEVISSKKQQLISSVFIILILMLASSLCMYSLEHEAQPEVFSNAFSGIWWATSTLLTVGYGDIYPITTLGKIFGIFISFLGVGMVAIPTGIISAGFVNQYTTIKNKALYGYKRDMHFIKIHIKDGDRWIGMRVADLKLPSGMVMAVIKRKKQILVPRGDVVLQLDDIIVIGAEAYEDEENINLKEIMIQDENPWCGQKIKDLNISKYSVIVLIKRKNKALIPNGNMIIQDNDRVFLYTQKYLAEAKEFEV
ncbi:MAG: ion transporter [Lachnospiraceae bacterium]|nr:ion transporter [Lachnospiraceae bacterium]